MHHGQKSALPKDHCNLDFYPDLLIVSEKRKINVQEITLQYNKCIDEAADVTLLSSTLQQITQCRLLLQCILNSGLIFKFSFVSK